MEISLKNDCELKFVESKGLFVAEEATRSIRNGKQMEVTRLDVRKLLALTVFLLGLSGCGSSLLPKPKGVAHNSAQKNQELQERNDVSTKPSEGRFKILVKEALLAKEFISKGTNENGLLLVEKDGWKLTLSTDNLLRNYMRDGDESSVLRWAESVSGAIVEEPKDWQSAKSNIMFAAHPSTIEHGDELVKPITPNVYRAVVHMSSKNMLLVGRSLLTKWKVSEDIVLSTASSNMAKLLEKTPIKYLDVNSHKLAFFDSSSPLKASLIFAPNFKEKIKKTIGWPVFVVIPCRDFLYATADRDILGKLGKTVRDEFEHSGYPLTTEVLEISDTGITPIGNFEERPK